MPSNQWGLIKKEKSMEEILAEMMAKGKAVGQEAGGRIGNAYEDLTTPDMGERFGNFAHKYSGGPTSLMDSLGNAADIVKSRGGNAIDSLMTPSDETPVGTAVREAKEGLQGLMSPQDSFTDRLGNAYDELVTPSLSNRYESFTNPVEPTGKKILRSMGDVVGNIPDAANALLAPESSVSERLGGFADSIKSGVQGMMQDTPEVNTQGRRDGDVWVENGFIFRMTPQGVEYRRAE